MSKKAIALIIALAFFYLKPLIAAEYSLPSDSKRLLGQPTIHTVVKGDYFQQLAEHYNVGFLALIEANPNIDPFLPPIDSKLSIPTQLLLPFVKRQGLVINLAELRLYYFKPNSNKVFVFPVGIGRQGLETPETSSYIGDKREDPIWRPTKAMKQRYYEEHGVHLANEVPPGKNNPFGKYALRLGTSAYLIHGTNQRFGIGMRASSGCIRLYDDDIKWLYENVAVNTPVRIINQPIKMSYESSGHKLLEIHQPLTKSGEAVPINSDRQLLRFIRNINSQSMAKVAKEIDKPSGLVISLIQ